MKFPEGETEAVQNSGAAVQRCSGAADVGGIGIS